MPKYFPLPVKAVYLRIKTQDMNREILRLAVPNIISNITVPLMGIVSSAVAGHLDNSAATIGALAIGVSIFNFIYWNCSFVRMGTSGLTAQAFGAGNFHECTNMLVRGILVAAILGLLVICFQNPLGRLALWAMNGNEIVHDYFYARIWAVQTPQTFRVEEIKKAYKLPYNDTFTDDASVYEAAGYIPELVEGNRENLKITLPVDLAIAEIGLKE